MGSLLVERTRPLAKGRIVRAGRSRRQTSAECLVAALNEPLPALRNAALRALERLLPTPQLGADVHMQRLVPCTRPWITLEPIEPADEGRARRWCADCAKPAVMIDDVSALRAQLPACAFFEDAPRPPLPPAGRGGWVIG